MSDAKVFVSYSNRDAAVAEKIAHALQGVQNSPQMENLS